MGTPGGGKNEVTARFIRHLSILAIHAFEDATLKKIFTAIVDWHFAKDFESDILRWARVRLQNLRKECDCNLFYFI